MERLQSAINKARKQRESSGISPNAILPEKVTKAKVEKAWEELRMAKISSTVSQDNRLVASVGGRDSAPYDMLRTRILQQARVNYWSSIAIVSPHSNCGKTTTAANLAFSFSRQRDLRTIVLDLDLRRIGLAKFLDQKCESTMGDVLLGRVDFEDHALCLGGNVALGLNSAPSSNSAEILQSQQTKEVLDGMRDRFRPDIMLFDLPPLMSTDDNYGFLKNVDCAILVAEAEKTTVSQIDVAERQLAELTNVMGVVLNKSKYVTGAYGYEYDYT